MGRHEISRFVHASLLDPAVESSPTGADSPLRRRLVCLITLVAGALLLRASLSVAPGDRLFYPATAALALLWLAGARLSGQVVPGHARSSHGEGASHGVLQSLVWGGLLLVLFLVGALVVSQVPPLAGPVQDLLNHAPRGSLPIVALLTALNGVGEEYFFRGALFQALPRHRQVLLSTVLYSVVTAFSGIPLLVLAAAMLGAVVGMQRRATGGFLAPTITHLVWSLGMLFMLPDALSLGAALFG